MRHGIPRVQHQVHDDAGHLRKVGLHAAQVGVESNYQADVLADDGPQQSHHLHHQCVQLHDGGQGNLFSDEIQNMRGHRGAARGRSANFFQLRTAGILRADAVQQYVAIAGDQGNQVGEIVGHARRTRISRSGKRQGNSRLKVSACPAPPARIPALMAAARAGFSPQILASRLS